MVLNAYEVVGLIALLFAIVPFPSVSNFTPFWFVVAKHGKYALCELRRYWMQYPQAEKGTLPSVEDKRIFAAPIVRYIPKGWVFGVAWTICYGLLISSSYVFLINYSTTGLWTAWYITLIGHIVMLRIWPSVFYGSESIRGMWAGFGVVLLAWLSSGAILAFYAIEGAWLPFGLFVFNVLWLTFASFLSLQFAVNAKDLVTPIGYDVYRMMENAGLVTRRIDVQVNSFNGRRV
jgi:tryptophan-rich sensory protein